MLRKAKCPEKKLTLQATHDLGQLFQKQAKLGQSMEMLERALKGFEKVLDQEHISTVKVFSDLADVYMRYGKLDEAEDMYKRAIGGFSKTWL